MLSREKKETGLDPSSTVDVPGRWFPKGHLRNIEVVYAQSVNGRANGGELGCGGVNPGYRSGRVC